MIPISKFNTRTVTKAAVASPIKSTSTQSDGRTFQGGAGYSRDERSALFLFAVTNFVGENTFYESAEDRDNRFAALARSVAVNDGPWFASFVRWLRADGNMRSAPLVAAAEGVKARLDAKVMDEVRNRAIVASVLKRADEPGEFVAYWQTHFGEGTKAQLPKPVKRAIAEAIEGLSDTVAPPLYTLYSAFKYDTDTKAARFADVVELVHPSPRTPVRGEFYTWLLDRRHGRADGEYPHLAMVHARKALENIPAGERLAFLRQDPEQLRTKMYQAGVTWEWLSSWYGRALDASFWQAVIPNMGYMALLRNLRNFDQAAIDDATVDYVSTKLSDPIEVANSKQFPMRFLSAYRAAGGSSNWDRPLKRALDLSLSNIPVLSGNTLILVDTSASMNDPFSEDGTLMRWDAAVLFGVALGQRCEQADVVSFSEETVWRGQHYVDSKVFPLAKGESLLRSVERWKSDGYFIGAGTDTVGAIRKHLTSKHTRVVILTDEQAGRGDVGRAMPATTPLYTMNLAGYEFGHAPSGSAYRHTFGGLTDAHFKIIPLIERNRDGQWPWLVDQH